MSVNLSPWEMVANADIVVQAVMGGLLVASVLCWTVALAKALELAGFARRTRADLALLGAARGLDAPLLASDRPGTGRESAARLMASDRPGTGRESAARLMASDRPGTGRESAAQLTGPCAPLLHAARDELLSAPGGPDGVKERAEWRIRRLIAAQARALSRGTGVLATIGATAPFIGLFGTVWGIMNSFVGIARTQTTNLAVVAPGIAEALLATAIGLVAAIPAVVLYNVFARAIGGHKALLADGEAEVMRLLSRELDLRAGTIPLRRAAE